MIIDLIMSFYWLFSPPLLRQIVNQEIVGAFAPFLTSTWDLLCPVIIPSLFDR